MSNEIVAGRTAVPMPLEFHGTAWGYFGIWVVNILLTILTLGLYGPWAKVRTNRYFYGSTLIDNNSFEYLANPVTILKGWLIAVALFIIYSIAAEIDPVFELVFIVIFLVLLPLIIVRAMAFRARNTAYRNIRFSFTGSYRDAFLNFVLFMALVPFTFGLLYPYVVYRQKRFLVKNSGFGTSDFSFTASAGEFYRIYMLAGALLILGAMVIGGLGAFIGYSGAGPVQGGSPNPAAVLVESGIIILIMTGFMYLYAFVQAGTGNAVWNNVDLEGHGFASSLRANQLAWIYITNVVAIILSLGLMIPWAKVRVVRYRLGKLVLLPAGDIGEFVQRERQPASALGEEIGDVFDVDIGL